MAADGSLPNRRFGRGDLVAAMGRTYLPVLFLFRFAGSGGLTAVRRSYRAMRLERIHQTQNPARASERIARIAVS